MRKEPAAITNWSPNNIALCTARQKEILHAAALMLKPGGRLCYSTCTFAPEENELQIAMFLHAHPDFHLIPITPCFGQAGFSELAPKTENLHFTRRIFPFHGGEGHFVALLQKNGAADSAPPRQNAASDNPTFDAFYAETFQNPPPGKVITIGERVYITTLFVLPKCPVIRNGIFAGTMQKSRFVPAHGLFACRACIPRQTVNLTVKDPRTPAYLHGEEIPCANDLKGYCGVCIGGIPLGFGKAGGGRLKNHYPKGLRTL